MGFVKNENGILDVDILRGARHVVNQVVVGQKNNVGILLIFTRQVVRARSLAVLRFNTENQIAPMLFGKTDKLLDVHDCIKAIRHLGDYEININHAPIITRDVGMVFAALVVDGLLA